MANTTICLDPQQLSKDDLVDEYEKLVESHRQLKRSEDRHLQQNHELKRSLQTATNAETYLSAELDSISSVHSGELQQLKQKHLAEMEDVKKKQVESDQNVLALEGELEAARKELGSLRNAMKELKEQHVPVVEKLDTRLQERLTKTELENVELLTTLETTREQLNAALMKIVQHERCIEDMQDQLECVQATLDSKREELDEKTQLYEDAQELVFQLNGELAALKTPETDPQKRGNSLFAEVDDQRQQMRQVLAAQKKHYLQMKQEFQQSQQEIRTLKRENAAMHKELQICSAMFMNADKTYKDKLNERIGQLLNDNQKLESKLSCTESMLVSMAKENGVTWLDSMLTFCKNETKQMKDMLHTCRLQKSAAEENVNNVTQDMARWRFEALKSRCTIINREALLDEHKIPYDTEIPNIAQYAQKLNTPSVRPIIVDTSAQILQPLPSVMTSRPSNSTIGTESTKPQRVADQVAEHIIDEKVKNEFEMSMDDIKENLCDDMDLSNSINELDVSIPIKIEENKNSSDVIEMLPPKVERSPFQPLHDTSEQIPSDTLVHSSITTFTPKYRNISINALSMASLEKSMSCMRTTTPRGKSAKASLQFTDSTTDLSSEDVLESKPCPKVMFSESTIMADERKDMGAWKTRIQPAAAATEAKVAIKSEPSESFRPKTTGTIRRVIVKSKKPTAFPK